MFGVAAQDCPLVADEPVPAVGEDGQIESLSWLAGKSPQPEGETLGKQAEGMVRCPRNRAGNVSMCRLTPSRRRTPGCPMPRWRLECKIAVENELVGCILLWFRMQKWKSWEKSVLPILNITPIEKGRTPYGS